MDYQEFLNEVCVRIQGEFEKAEVSCLTVSKVNTDKKGIVVKNTGRKLAPIVYFDDIYQDYRKSMDMDSCMEKAVKRIKAYLALPALDDTLCGDLLVWEKISKYLYPFLVSTDRNHQLLQMMKHRSFLDLSVCYMLKLPINKGEDCSGILRVTSDMAAVWGCTEEELYKKAMENVMSEGYSVKKLEDVLRHMLKEEYVDKIPEGLNLLENSPANPKVSVLSNSESRYGAAGILDRKLLDRFADECGSDFYILPSSIHEVLLLPYDGSTELEELNRMVQQVNEEELDEEEILSDHAYYYSREKKRIFCC